MNALTDVTPAPMMPPEQPLAFPVQDLKRDYHDCAAPVLPRSRGTSMWRWAMSLTWLLAVARPRELCPRLLRPARRAVYLLQPEDPRRGARVRGRAVVRDASPVRPPRAQVGPVWRSGPVHHRPNSPHSSLRSRILIYILQYTK